MRPIKWLFRAGLPVLAVIVMVTATVGLTPRLVSNLSLPADQACPPPADVTALRAAHGRAALAGTRAELGAIFGPKGEISGRLLTITPLRQPPRTVTLAAESFVSRPIAGVVVFGQAMAGSGSALRAVDLVTGCEFALPVPDGIVRAAVLDRAMTVLYAHTVRPDDRADLGIWRVDLSTSEVSRALEPVTADDAYGRTYGTRLHWSEDGRELAVQSCGWLSCRTRTLDTSTGAVRAYAERPHGELIGFTTTAIYAFDGCDSWPCPVLAIDRATGEVAELEADAYTAVLGAQADSGATVLTIETPAGTKELVP